MWFPWKWPGIARFHATEPQMASEFASISKVLERVCGKGENHDFMYIHDFSVILYIFMGLHESSWKPWFSAPQRLPAPETYIILVISYVSTSSARSEFAFFMEIPKNPCFLYFPRFYEIYRSLVKMMKIHRILQIWSPRTCKIEQ